MRLENKVVLVTGGGAGIGKAICLRLAQEGAAIVVTDIDESSAQAVAAEIQSHGGKALPLHQDVTVESAWRETIDRILQQFESLNVVVNNAGIAIPENIEDMTLDQWRTTQRVNLDAVFLGTQAAIRAMKDTGGSIINMSSIEGIVGNPILPSYNASKGGVRILTKSTALHCADSGYKIRVNSIHPGFIKTAMTDPELAAMPTEMAEAFFQEVVSNIPLGEMGLPSDIANGVLFLASDESRYITGAELVIDGGYTAR